jgi:hypothetical protein
MGNFDDAKLIEKSKKRVIIEMAKQIEVEVEKNIDLLATRQVFILIFFEK